LLTSLPFESSDTDLVAARPPFGQTRPVASSACRAEALAKVGRGAASARRNTATERRGYKSFEEIFRESEWKTGFQPVRESGHLAC